MIPPGKQSANSVLAEFDGKRDALQTFCQKTKDLIEDILRDANIPFQSVQARVKSKEKLKQKYLDPEKNYSQLNDITDQAALRVITYYEDEIDHVAEILKREFDVDSKNSVDKRETEPNKFSYYALNYICKYPTKRSCQPEYKKFADTWCEIQITSILRHAWSEIEHPWYDLKGAYPDDIKRRFARMAALLEVAEIEFENLRKAQSDYRKSLAVQVEAKVPNIPIDAVSLRSFVEQEPLVTKIDASLASVFGRALSETVSDAVLENRAKLARLAGIMEIQELRALLEKHEKAIGEFAKRSVTEKLWPTPSNPFISRSVCIAQLAQLLVSAQGTQALSNFNAAFGIQVRWDLAHQVNIAQEVMAKYPD